MLDRSKLFCVLLPLAAAACGADDGVTSGDEANLSAGACAVVDANGDPLSASARDDLDDVFFETMLAKGSGKCPTTADSAFARMQKVFEAGFFRSTVVSEAADKNGTTTPYRFVVAAGPAGSATGDIFLSIAGNPKDGLVEDLVEAMGFSPSKQAYAFYAVTDGTWQRVGDGTEITPETPKPFACVSCHPTGSPNMKELTSPWNNWSGTRMTDIRSSSHKGFKAVDDAIMNAYGLETIVRAGVTKSVKGYVDRLLTKKQNKTLLRHLMCDVGEVTLASSAAQNMHRFAPFEGPETVVIPQATFYRDPAFEGFGGRFDRDAYESAVKAVGQTFANGAAGDTMFAFFVPERGLVDTEIVKELKRRKRLNDDMIKDVLVTDFTNPVYSHIRCALAETAPDEGTNAEAVRKAWITNLEASDLPGATELRDRLSKTGNIADNDAVVAKFIAACRARSDSDVTGFALDMVRLASQRRLELEELHPDIVESDLLLPTATKKAPKAHELTLDPVTCKLVPQKK